MIRKQTINSGRARGMNSTTLRQDGNNTNQGRLIIKKTISPGFDASQPGGHNNHHFPNGT
jgi:hypothetical protein